MVGAEAEVEVCRKKHDQTSAKASAKKDAQVKAEAAKETYEAAVTALRAAQGSYSLGLDDMKRDYKRLGKPIIDLVQEQIAYHRVRVPHLCPASAHRGGSPQWARRPTWRCGLNAAAKRVLNPAHPLTPVLRAAAPSIPPSASPPLSLSHTHTHTTGCTHAD